MKGNLLNNLRFQLFLSIFFSVFGSIIVMLLAKGLGFELNKAGKSILTFTFTSLTILLLFPRVFKIPFGKQSIPQWLVSIGLYLPKRLHHHILLGVLLGLISLAGMFLGSYFTGKYEFSWTNISLGHFLFCLTPGIWEEIMFRGVVMIILIRIFNSVGRAFWVQTAIFAACHLSSLDLGSLLEIVSVFIIGLTFSLTALRTRALIAGIVYHYIHDAFLFLVQNPKGEYFGFVDNFTFYAFLWSAMLINLMIVIIFTQKFRVIGGRSPFEVDGIVDSFSILNPNRERLIKTKKFERLSLLIFAASFFPVLPVSIELSTNFITFALSFIVLCSLAGFAFYKKIDNRVGVILLLLNSIGAWITGHMFYLEGSERVYLVYYLVGFLYLAASLFMMILKIEDSISS